MADHTYSDGESIYDVTELMKAAVTCERFDVPTGELITYLEDQRWGDRSPIEFVFNSRVNYDEHEHAITRADLSCPIIFGPSHELLDGLHRVVKAARLGAMRVNAVRLAEMPPPVKRVREAKRTCADKRTVIATVLRQIWNTDVPRSVRVDLACLAVSMKRFARVVCWPGQVSDFRDVLEECGLSVRLASKVLYYGLAEDGVEELASVDNSTWPHVFRLGGILGYPTCCCLRASEIGERNLDAWHDQMANACDALCPAISPRSYLDGQAMIAHIPCSPTCRASQAISRNVTGFLRELRLALDG